MLELVDLHAVAPKQTTPPASIPSFPRAATLPPQEKSSGIAVLLTVLWPGAGHLYLGLTHVCVSGSGDRAADGVAA
ncbi:MAG: hypothetical protein ABW249_01035, partial [Solirubrobacterales bacterium]